MREKDVKIILRGLDGFIENYDRSVNDVERMKTDRAAFRMIDNVSMGKEENERFGKYYIDGTQGIPVVNLNTE